MRKDRRSRDHTHDETAHDDRPERRRSDIGRRDYLRLVGAAGVAATATAATTGTAGATSHYTTYTVNAGETFTRRIGSDETFENALIDATADDTGVEIDARGSNWAIRNVGIKGQLDSSDTGAFTLQVNDGSTGVFENVYLGDGAVDGGYGGMFVPTSHEGTLEIRELNVQYWPDNGEYGSAPGRSENGGRGGLVEIERCFARNNNIAGFRLGTDRSIVRDSVVYVDEDVPNKGGGGVNARGIWVKEGGSVTIENCDVLLDHPDGSYCIWEGDDNSVSLARVIDSEVDARNGALGRFKGNVETVNVGNDPNVEQPPGVPKSAKEAALGRNLPKSVYFAGGDETDELDYVFETTGEVAGTRSTESGDTVSGGRATGSTNGDYDIHRYDGEISSLDVSLPSDGSIASVTVDRSNGRIEFEGGDRNDETLRYYLRVTDTLDPAPSVDGNDVYSNDEAKGILRGSYSDAYSYTGDIAALRVELGTETLVIEVETPD